MCGLLVKFLVSTGLLFFNALVGELNPKIHDCEIPPQESRDVTVSHGMKNISIS